MTEAKRPADVVQATISESAAIRRLNDAREKIVAQDAEFRQQMKNQGQFKEQPEGQSQHAALVVG